MNLLAEIIDHYAEADCWPDYGSWAMPDDQSSLCFEHNLPDGTKFWLDIEKDHIMVLWRRPGEEARVIRLVEQALSKGGKK